MDDLERLSAATKQIVRRVAEALKDETGAVAIMLTGPQALGLDRAEDKIYFVAITEDPDGVVEHRFADRYAGIEREMEIGIFPKKFVSKLVSNGYWDMVSLRAVEVLRIAIPLIDESGYGASAAQAMARHLPRKGFASGKIHGIKATFDDAVSLYSKGDYGGAVLVAREALRLAVELALGQASGDSGGDDDRVRAVLGEEAYARLLEGLGISHMTDAELRQHLANLIDRARATLKDLGISDDFLTDEPPGGRIEPAE